MNKDNKNTKLNNIDKKLHISDVENSTEEEPVMTFGERCEDGFVKVYRNG